MELSNKTLLWESDIKKAVESLSDCTKIVFDLETTGLNPYGEDEILGVAFGHSTVGYYYIPYRHKVGCNASIETMTYTNEFLSNSEKFIITWNGKFDIHFNKKGGLSLNCKLIDVMLMAHMNNEYDRPFSLENHGLKRLGKSKTEEQDELIKLAGIYFPEKIKRLRNRESILNIVMGNLKYLPIEDVGRYAMNDLYVTEKLYDLYDEKLKNETYYPIVEQLGVYSKIIRQMEENGLLIDVETTKEKSLDATNCMEEIIEEIHENTGMRINPNSWKQVTEVLLEYSPAFQALPIGLRSTDKGTLSKLNDPIAKLVTEYHQWSKYKGTYLEMFLETLDHNNRIHYSIRIHGTVSTRLSCPKPAIQTIPRTSEIFKVKDCVISPPGYLLVEVDESQLELRVAAHFSKEPSMIRAYAEGKDLHTVTAELLGISRQDAKPVNFGFLYGSGAESFQSFAEDNYGLKLTLLQAKRFRKQFFDSYPGLAIYTESIIGLASRMKYIRLLTGRKLHFEDEYDYHNALNKQIQGSSAEILRIAMTKMDRDFNKSDIEPPKMLIQVHDSLLFEIKEDLIDYWLPKITHYMTDIDLRVPLVIESKVGSSWGDMKKYTVKES